MTEVNNTKEESFFDFSEFNLEGIEKNVESMSSNVEAVKEIIEERVKPITDRLNETDKKMIKDDIRSAVKSAVKKEVKIRLKVFKTTSNMLNSPYAHITAKLLGGKEGDD